MMIVSISHHQDKECATSAAPWEFFIFFSNILSPYSASKPVSGETISTAGLFYYEMPKSARREQR